MKRRAAKRQITARYAAWLKRQRIALQRFGKAIAVGMSTPNVAWFGVRQREAH